MTDGLRSKSESFSMWVKSTLLSLSCIKPHCTACPVPGGNDSRDDKGCDLWLSQQRALGPSDLTSDAKYVRDESEVSLDHICSIRKMPACCRPCCRAVKRLLLIPGAFTALRPRLIQLTVENSVWMLTESRKTPCSKGIFLLVMSLGTQQLLVCLYMS